MNPPIIKKTRKMEKKAAIILLIPHDSNFFATGSSINDIIKAMLKGIRMSLANIRIAKSAKTVAIAKNNFWKDRFILNKF